MIEYWKSNLSNNSKKQYDLLLKAIRQQAKTVDLALSLCIVGKVQEIYQYILSDHPEFYYVSPQISAVMGSMSLKINLSYLYDEKQKRCIEQSFSNLWSELEKESNKSDVEKVYTAIFLLMKDSRYDVDNFYNQNAASAIHFHVAQCSGFALAFKYAMDYLGIWSIVVTGNVSNCTQSGPHAWNIVKLNGLYYHIDVTSLARIKLDKVEQLSRYKLFESDSEKKQQGYIWDISKTPSCSEMASIPTWKSSVCDGADASSHKESIVGNDENLPVFTRLFDLQCKIKECIENRITHYEFLLKIPVYSSDKLMKIILNYAIEQGKQLSILFEVRVEYINNKTEIKFNFKN